LGNVVKYVLRAPYKGGAEDLRKALQYLEWEMETPGPMLSHRTYARVEVAIDAIINHLVIPRNAMADMQSHILLTLDKYLAVGDLTILSVMLHAVQRMLDLQGQP
jgi:hypothetical protein